MTAKRVVILGLRTGSISFVAVFTQQDYENNIHLFGDEFTRNSELSTRLERGAEAAETLREMFGGVRPVVSNVRLPTVPPDVSLLTADRPYGTLIDYGQAHMDEDILNVSFVGGFAFTVEVDKTGLRQQHHYRKLVTILAVERLVWILPACGKLEI